MQKKVLVTGGSGFIGSHLVHRLLKENAEVAVTVRYGNVVKNERLRGVYNQIHVIEADLRNRGALDQIRDFNPDIVFHLAAYNHVGESFTQVEECFDVNAKGSANILDTCRKVEKFIYISTSEVYGEQTSVPFVETMTPNPISPYAITKYAGEMYCRLVQKIIDDPSRIVVLRPFNAFGPYQSSKAVIPELIVNCLKGNPIRTTKGEQTREFNFVGNLVDGMIRAAQHKGVIEGPINLAKGEEIAIRDLVQLIAKLTETTSSIEIGALPYRPTEIWRMYADANRARTVLGWEPPVSLEDGLKITVDWFREYLANQR
jgi:nucleoside-diphosphate-sugar epimerase